ncbi:MAG: fatty acid desaturase family protein [Alphaproteobacteria bacterium]
MPDKAQARNYSVSGPENARAVERHLANAEWYRTKIPRKRMKELMRRSDGPATRDTIAWLGLLAVFGGLGALFWGSWAAVPFFLAYGVLYGSAGDSRWHECSHGTAFKTQWKNDAVYQLASFMMMRSPTAWRWSHARHHTDTIIVGRDPEIIFQRPPALGKIAVNVVGLLDVPKSLWLAVRHAYGTLTPDEQDYVPESEQPKIYREARVWLLIYGATIVACVASGSILPAMYIGLPRAYGAWHHILTGVTQHSGLAEDALDHRLNSRTMYINPISRFIYWNMNYHIEHHMYPMVPYHALPRLHEELKVDTPRVYTGFLDAYREIIPALLRQRREPSYFVARELPLAGTTPATAAAE